MKKLFALVLAFMLALYVVPAMAETYQGTAQGRNGEIVVEMTVENGVITNVAVVSHQETAGIADPALTQIPQAIVDGQTLAVDTVASATITCDAIIEAAKAAATAAGLDVDKLMVKADAEAVIGESTESTADVIVIGAGAAGLAAAAGAGENGATVIVLEANAIIGGSTIRSGGHMMVFDDAINASMPRNDEALQTYLTYQPADFGEWATELEQAQTQIRAYLESDQVGRFDSVQLAMVDHYLKGIGTDRDGQAVTLDYELNRDAIYNATAINEWMMKGGMEVQPKMYNAHGGTPVGGAAGMVKALEKLALDGNAQIVLNMRATELIVDGDRIVGVKAVDKNGVTHTYHANKGVVIATGSFSSNGEMCATYQKTGTGLGAGNGSTNPATNTGDGIVMAEAVGAQLRDMQFIMTVMQGYHESSSLGEAGKINGQQQLVVNAEGLRFVDESNKNAIGSKANNQTAGLAYFVGDAKMIEALNKTEGFVDMMTSRGDWFVVADTLEEAAQKAGLDPVALTNTVAAFNGYVDAGSDPDFGRTAFNGKVENGPFAIVKMEMHYHLTFGGLVIDTDAHVLNADNQWINGLYAAGDVISGFEGDAHQSGDCLTTVIYYGKVAGENAAQSK